MKTPDLPLRPSQVKHRLIFCFALICALSFGYFANSKRQQLSPLTKAKQTKAPKSPKRTKPHPMKIRGVTLSCFGWGAAWATPLMYNSMKELRSLGSNWISYHPYSWINNDGSIRFSRSLSQPTVMNPLRFGKTLGVKTLLKPHIGYWGSRFSWRGSITFQSEAGWKRFFDSYERWIVVQAQMAQAGKADLFSVGLEYKLTEHREKEWRRIIKAVRKVYKGKILYAANWDTYHKIKFWDALDFIGIQAYFPISKKSNPSEKDLHKGWDKIFPVLRRFAKKHKKKIIFTELGYNYSSRAASHPWEHTQGGPNAGQIKKRCIRVALKRVAKESFILGVFLWKWFPSSRSISSNFTLQYPAMKKIIKKAWK